MLSEEERDERVESLYDGASARELATWVVNTEQSVDFLSRQLKTMRTELDTVYKAKAENDERFQLRAQHAEAALVQLLDELKHIPDDTEMFMSCGALRSWIRAVGDRV